MIAVPMSRGAVWSRVIFTGEPERASGYPASVHVVDGTFGGGVWRAIAVVPDTSARFPRARAGEMGLDEGLAVARAVRSAPPDAAILAIVDVPGQAFGRREEAAGLPLALAAAVDAYIAERRSGRPVLALVTGRAISGAFLAHGLQAGWIGALADEGVEVHVMSAASVARVTRATPAEVARVAQIVPATARDIATFATLGAVDALFTVRTPLAPLPAELDTIRAALCEARAAGLGVRAPRARLANPAAQRSRTAALDVRARIAALWDA